MSKINVVAKKALSVVLMITVGSFYSLLTTTTFAQVSPKLVGYLSTKGQVTLNGINVTSGATVFGGSQIKTGATSSAIIGLGKMGQIEVEPESELTLRLDAGVIGGHLRSGRATISAPIGIAVNLATTDGIAVADGKQASVLTVDVTSGSTRVASLRSEAKVTAGDQIEVVAAGQEVFVGTQAGQKGSPCECFDKNGKKTGDGTLNDKGVCECKDQPVGGIIGGGAAATGLTPVALVTLVILGVGGAAAGIIAAVQSDNNTGSVTRDPLSVFTPS